MNYFSPSYYKSLRLDKAKKKSAVWARWRRQLSGKEIRFLLRKMAPVVSLIQWDDAAPLTFGSANVWRKDGGRKWAGTRTEEVRLQNQYASRGSATIFETEFPSWKKIPSLRACLSESQDISCILWKLKVHNRVYKSHIKSQMNPIHTLTSCLFNNSFRSARIIVKSGF